jgi:hypothetical protein
LYRKTVGSTSVDSVANVIVKESFGMGDSGGAGDTHAI